MRIVSNSHAVCVLPLVAALSAGAAHAAAEAPLADNIIAVEVRGDRPDHRNTPLVDVTVCNTRGKCKTVPNVMVDTGTTGLRLFRGAVADLDLEPVKDRSGNPITNWGSASYSELWGPLHRAKVRLGKVTTETAIPVQLFDLPKDGEALPQGYARVDNRKATSFRFNGVLGIGPQRHHAAGYLVGVSDSWYSRAPSRWVAQKVDRSQQLANPIAHFPAPYNNGSVITLPEVDLNSGAARVRGWLGLGIGEPTDGLFASGQRVLSHEFNDKLRFPAMLGERQVELTARTSASGLLLDLAHLGIPKHASDAGVYDAKVPTTIKLAVPHGGAYVSLARPLYVGSTVDHVAAHPRHGALPMIVAEPVRSDGPQVLGLPFYYGRTVATGLAGTVNPFAQGQAVNANPVPAAPFSGPGGVRIIDDHVDRIMSIEDDEDIEIIADDEGFELVDDKVQIFGGTAIIDDYIGRSASRAQAPAQASVPAPVDEDFIEYSTSPNGYIAYTDPNSNI